MNETQHLFRPLDDVETPDLWDRIRRGDPARPLPGPSPKRKLIVALVALSTAAVLFVVLSLAFGRWLPSHAPATSSPRPIKIEGPAFAPIPDVIGMDGGRAIATLRRAGFGYQLTYKNVPGNGWRAVEVLPAQGYRVPVLGTRLQVVIATHITPLPAGAAGALDCGQGESMAFGGPRLRLTPGGAAYIVGNLIGRSGLHSRYPKVVQVTFGGPEWEGLWHVIRDGSVVAVVDYPSLDGIACKGSEVAGT